ncbi:hypothetical protein PSH81_00850 [Pseudomonas sp. FP2335]|uniref:hypothetical protein n=1 Tax=Pseudomonas sp. FP2335 TaxID=2954092 RepID=UPI002733FC1F|nr:hypothetical protein [Pseudomonas sp. FP2335]WLH79552.1 hypothetical protein PSH81_00850 [Pseudomonas sp. FP2335]
MISTSRMFTRTLTLLCLAALAGCQGVPYRGAEDQARINNDLALGATAAQFIPLRWAYSNYGIQNGVQTEDAIAVVQPGLVTLVGYESGHYVRKASFPAAAVDCAYVFESEHSDRPVWLLQRERIIFLSPSDHRGNGDQARRLQLVKQLAGSGFKIQTDAQGSAYRPTGKSERQLVLNTVIGHHMEEVAENQAYNVCRPQ